jgi:hypothetical protein
MQLFHQKMHLHNMKTPLLQDIYSIQNLSTKDLYDCVDILSHAKWRSRRCCAVLLFNGIKPTPPKTISMQKLHAYIYI